LYRLKKSALKYSTPEAAAAAAAARKVVW